MQAASVGGRTFAILESEGPLLNSEQAALDLIGKGLGAPVDMIVVPRSRLSPEFFDLKTGLLGAVAQKFVNYQLCVGLLGDFSDEIARSNAFRDFVLETNQRGVLVFAPDIEALSRLVG